jgi:hypothetical protein
LLLQFLGLIVNHLMKHQSLNEVKIVLCSYCNTDPGLKPGSETIWNGFFDKDTNQNVCWKCKRDHYARKFMNSGTKGLYSEFPIQYIFKPFS